MRGSVKAIPRNSYFSHQVRGGVSLECTSLRHDHNGLRSPRRTVTETRRQELRIGDMAAIPEGAFIQIMPLTWDSFLLPVMDRDPWHDLTGSTSGQRRGSHPRLGPNPSSQCNSTASS